MDYGKSGAPKMGKNKPRHAEHNAKGTKKNPFGKQTDKSELLKRMKAAAEKTKTED
ncbi:cobaltochelatase [Leisingera methylohalidivorans DSM 14336]|uniref:Cobaltochelatase n=1 Tax=Leisingera methylohalidivorans DSM 14336 TaxID=999552 RepID=V9VP84_9RHOB|nr:cobaltochelatase [Leisingera methylohalidivorans DSM 14336]